MMLGWIGWSIGHERAAACSAVKATRFAGDPNKFGSFLTEGVRWSTNVDERHRDVYFTGYCAIRTSTIYDGHTGALWMDQGQDGKPKAEGEMTKAMNVAIEAGRTALRRLGASEEYIMKVLADLGIDAPREGNKQRQPVAKTVKSEDEVTNARPGVYRVVGVERLYLKKTKKSGSYFVRWRLRKDSKEEKAAIAKAAGTGKQPRTRLEIGLGSIKNVKLVEAIARAKDIDAGLNKQVNPRDIREGYAAKVAAETEAAKIEAALPTVAEAAERFTKWMVNPKNEHAWKGARAVPEWLNPLKTYAFPAIGGMKVNEVEPGHVIRLLAAMRNEGKSTTKVRTNLRTLFKWLIGEGERDSKLGNPAGASVVVSDKPSGEHYERVDLKQAPAVFQALLRKASGNAALSAWIWMILTAARPSEALTARWDQLNFNEDGPLWRNEVSKTGKTLEVPLTARALAIVNERLAGRDLKQLAAEKALIFAGATGGKLAHSNFGGAPKRAGIDEKMTAHGWRSVCADTLSEHCHISREVRETVLGHALPGVEGSYRRQDGLAARKIALHRYEAWLLSGKEQGGQSNIIEFKRAS